MNVRPPIAGSLTVVALFLAACVAARTSPTTAVGTTGWTWRQEIVTGRISPIADTQDAGSVAACNYLREVIAAQAEHPVHQCSAVTLSLVRGGRRTILYDLFVLTEPGDDNGALSEPLWDSFQEVSLDDSQTARCGRYHVFIYRRGGLEIRELGEPIEERNC